jgi:hypothetical protein
MKSNNDYGKEFVINKNARKTISKGQIRTQTRQRWITKIPAKSYVS